METFPSDLDSASARHRPKPQEQSSQPVLTSHEYGWDGGTLERFGRLTCKLR